MESFDLKHNNTLSKKSKISYYSLRTIGILIIVFVQISFCYANGINGKDKISDGKNADSIEKMLKRNEKNSLLLFKDNKINREHSLLLEAIYKNIQNADITLKTGIDYKGFTSELDYVIKLKKTAIDGIIQNRNEFQTLRNITVTSVMLKELQARIDIQLAKINKNRSELSEMQSKIDSLTIKDALFALPKDLVTRRLYYDRYIQMSSDVDLLNKRFKGALDSISKLQIIASNFKNDLQKDVIETDNIRKNEFVNLLSPDGNIFKPSSNKMSFYQSFNYSFSKEVIVLLFFISNHINTILLMFLFSLGLIAYLITLKNKYKNGNLYYEIELSKKIFKHPIACAILIAFTLFNFSFAFPPFAFTALVWFTSMIALTVVNNDYYSKKEMAVWGVYFIFIFLALFDNNILLHSVKEVFLILLLSLGVSGFSLYILKKDTGNINPMFRYTLYTVVLLEMAAISFIIFENNYNFGKLLMIVGATTILMYYLFVNTYRLIFDIINYSDFLRESDQERQMDIEHLENNALNPKTNILFILCWLITISKSSYFFHSLVDPVVEFFTMTRTVGDINYSFKSIFLFFFIIITAVFIARIVSFLTSNTFASSDNSRANKFGNWLLLVQITIFTIGLSLAFITSGIPVDRLTIIMSALGVGIGFGLQTLVNNLVSGLIIAFEKPVNMGDVIEISGQMVKMKSIGIRSSVVTSFDGADVVIPNGDLLSQHLTNWTLSSNKKRTDIAIGVAYGTNLEQAKALLLEVLNNNESVLQNPEPIVWITEFNSSAIDIVVKFWVSHIDFSSDVKSELIVAIDAVFRANDIEIPLPKQDIYIKQEKTKETKE